jgi:hypothetical protein
MPPLHALRAQPPSAPKVRSVGHLIPRALPSITALPLAFGDRVRGIAAFIEQRQDDIVRREIADRHEVLAHRYEVGGDFSMLP